MRHRTLCALALLMLAAIPASAGTDDKAKIQDILNNIFKRKDIDAITRTVSTAAPIYGSGESQSLITVLKDRDKKRALGDGSYEEVVKMNIVQDGTVAVAITATKFQQGKSSHVFYNTVTFQKVNGNWTIMAWHQSRE